MASGLLPEPVALPVTDKPAVPPRVSAALIVATALVILYLIPRPAEISAPGWRVLAIFACTVMALMLRPIPGGAAVLLGVPSPAAAQMVMSPVYELPFDRPESWALKYFTSATLLSGLESPRTQKPGAVSIGLEAGWLPPLTDAQQLVGYYGTEAQDLNKAPFFLRPNVELGLPGRLSLIVAFVPPVKMFGITPKLLALAIQRPIYETPSWAVGLRAYGQVGTVQGS